MYNSSSNQDYFKNNKSRNDLEILNEGIIVEKPDQAKNYTENAAQIIEENNKGYKNYAKIITTVLNDNNLSDKQKKEINEQFFYIQQTKDINIQLKKLYDQADINLKPVIETVLLTSSQSIDKSNSIINLNKALMEKVNKLQSQNNKSHELINELNNYIKKIENKEKLKKELA